MKFSKMQAFGNDYVYVDAINQKITNENQLAKLVANRHYGVGSDGLVLICSSEVADFKMRIFNVDGSEAEMCGNALRSVSKYVYEKGLTKKTNLKIETLGGIKTLELIIENNQVVNIKASIGKPILKAKLIPVKANKELFLEEEVQVLDKKVKISSLSWGNPHSVVFVDDLKNLEVEKYGPAIEHLAIFPNKTNVTFATIVDNEHIKIREWERGCTETIGCATGCASAFVIANILGLVKDKCYVEQIGGTLKVEKNNNDEVIIIGPSHFVFEGFMNIKGENI